jgi:hypothetical protein
MTEGAEENRKVGAVRLFGPIFLLLPSLLFKSGGATLHFKRAARKGGKIFRKELMNQGIDKITAKELTEIYLEGSNLQSMREILSKESIKNRHIKGKC